MFITSKTVTGNMGGLAGADAICNKLAAIANVPGTYKAWLSDSKQSPNTRLTYASGAYVLLDGTPLANNWADLVDGPLAHAIDHRGGQEPDGNRGMRRLIPVRVYQHASRRHRLLDQLARRLTSG